MGEEVSLDSIPDPSPAPEAFFAEVILSPRAIDRASQIVPEQAWKATGLHTWLSGRANKAFEKIEIGQKEITLGKLRYRFAFKEMDRPTLETVMLV